MAKTLKVTKSRWINAEFVELDMFGSSTKGADQFLAYMYTCVGSGTIAEVLDRLFPFEEGLKDIASERLSIIMEKAAKKIGIE